MLLKPLTAHIPKRFQGSLKSSIGELYDISHDMDLLYEGHITTTKLQKALLAVTSGIACMLYPQRPDFIALFGETTGHRALKRLFVKMRSDPEGAAVLANRPRIRSSTIDFGYLRQLPSHTFGSHYVAFLDRYGYSPNDRGLVNFVDDPDLAYVMQRYREVHDLVHVLLGQQTDMLGEVVVKWVEGLQLGLPLGLLGGFFGALRLKPNQTRKYLSTHLPYAIDVGRHSRNLLFVYWERYWSMDIEELRNRLRVPPPPQVKKIKKFPA